MSAAFASEETTVRKTGTATTLPNNDVCRLSYYLKSATVSCGVDIIADDLVDCHNAHRLPRSRADSIFKLAVDEFKVTEVLNKTIFLDEDGDICGEYLNQFLEVSKVSSVLAVQSEVLLAGQQTEISTVMVFKKRWLDIHYFEPLRRNKDRAAHAVSARNPGLLLAQLLEAITIEEVNEEESNHCNHCKGLDGNCACKTGCDVKSATKCSAVHHCDHCRGLSGGVCACKEGCPENAHSKCVVVHSNVTCDGCRTKGVRGIRYKCNQCFDYDLCQECYVGGKHIMTHFVEKINRVGSQPVPLQPRQKPLKFLKSGQRDPETNYSSDSAKPATWSQHTTEDNGASASTESGNSNVERFVGESMSVREMKEYLSMNGVSADGVIEKDDIRKLVWATQIDGMGMRELDVFMDAQGIDRKTGWSVSVKRAAAVKAFPAHERPAAPKGSRLFQPGQNVELFGLQKENMNGKMAVVLRANVTNGRVLVRLLDDTMHQYNIKPENLQVMSEDLD